MLPDYMDSDYGVILAQKNIQVNSVSASCNQPFGNSVLETSMLQDFALNCMGQIIQNITKLRNSCTNNILLIRLKFGSIYQKKTSTYTFYCIFWTNWKALSQFLKSYLQEKLPAIHYNKHS